MPGAAPHWEAWESTWCCGCATGGALGASCGVGPAENRIVRGADPLTDDVPAVDLDGGAPPVLLESPAQARVRQDLEDGVGEGLRGVPHNDVLSVRGL